MSNPPTREEGVVYIPICRGGIGSSSILYMFYHLLSLPRGFFFYNFPTVSTGFS